MSKKQNQPYDNPQQPGINQQQMNMQGNEEIQGQPIDYQSNQPMMGQAPEPYHSRYQVNQPLMSQPFQQQQMVMNPQMMSPQMNPQMMNPQMNPQMMNQQMYGQAMFQQQQMGMVPINPNFFGGMQCFYVTDPFLELANAKKASIKQRFEPWEVISGCETPNQYYVFVEDHEGRQKYLFKAKEESNCCCRNFCSGSSREFILHINTIMNQGGKEIKSEFARFERPFKCTCCCLARPQLSGRLIEKGIQTAQSPQQGQAQPQGQNQKDAQSKNSLGKVVERFTCCDPKIETRDKEGKVTWTITCDCCQCGYCCRNSMCGMCSEVNFEIYKGTGPLEGKAPGKIKKKFKGLKSMIGDADFFDLFFPTEAPPEERFMLVVAVIMLDYMYYEDKDKNNQMHHHHHGFY